ncbi:hypothetical protein [Nocardia arthritidis]|uniref:Uncharacterized protein n=1 Tax=Nocardia arthritidis TaxID=228602 RepID=A0A6G9YUP1_9NOCA|nr:hypothetical protein [Nocardia arthritidis]QIS16563.1 hypothetical protein F5544_43800 [Nocardia arthritidis]
MSTISVDIATIDATTIGAAAADAPDPEKAAAQRYPHCSTSKNGAHRQYLSTKIPPICDK